MRRIFLTLCCVLLAGCFSKQPDPVVIDLPTPEPAFESYGASFQGVLHPSPDADYQLITDIGKIVYITTGSDLAKYLKQKVEISGTVTGEQNSILNVALNSVTTLENLADATIGDVANDENSAEEEGEEEDIETEDTPEEEDNNPNEEEVVISSSTLSVSSSSSIALDEDFIEDAPKSKQQATMLMASESLTADQWTFTYCTHHFDGFCIPIHKNWWYKAFGATSDSLFHIEIGEQELLELGDGIISVDLLKQGQDKDLDARYPRVPWGGNKFIFVVSGPQELQEAMQYIADSISSSV